MSPNLTITPLPLPGLKRVQRRQHRDDRGVFARLFCAEALATSGWSGSVAQINHSVTHHSGTVRGLHYQRPPHSEVKLVSCIRGEIWDVAVDLRPHSPTFLRWHAERLNAHEGTALLIPAGFAHGFQVLSDDAELVYAHSAAYAPEAEAGLNATDPTLSITWPLPIHTRSPRDIALPLLTPEFEGVSA